MNFLDILQTYFRGEKLEAYFFILPAGLVLLVLGVVTLKAEQGAYAWGMAIPLIIFGIVLAGTGVGVGTRTNNQVDELVAQYQSSPAEMVKLELPRMEKVSKNFRITFYAFGALVLFGLALHYFGGQNLGRGLGSALILCAAIALIVDGFAERRAEPYMHALQKIENENTGNKS